MQAYHEAKRHQDFYTNEYEPWRRTFDGQGYASYLQSRQQGGQQGQQPAEELDWDDPVTAQRAYERQQREFQAHRADYDQTKRQYLELLQLLQQAEELRREELYAHLGRGGFKPQIDPRAVVEYAMQRGIGDLSEAARRMKQDLAAQRGAQSPTASRQATRQFRKELDRYGGVRKAVQSLYPHLSA